MTIYDQQLQHALQYLKQQIYKNIYIAVSFWNVLVHSCSAHVSRN